MLLVAVSDARRHCKSGLQLLPVATLDVTPPQFLASASASNVQESNFTLTVSLDEPGMPTFFCKKGPPQKAVLLVPAV